MVIIRADADADPLVLTEAAALARRIRCRPSATEGLKGLLSWKSHPWENHKAVRLNINLPPSVTMVS